MKVTIYDIAKASNCSISTVSKALSDSTDINVKTKADILRCAIEMGYQIGRKRAKSKGTIALFAQCCNLSSVRFEYQMIFGFKLMAERHGYDVELLQKDTHDSSWSFTKDLEGKSYCGVFLLRAVNMERIKNEVMECRLPLVSFENEYDLPNAASVSCDNTEGIRLAIEHLASLGHKNIAYYGGLPTAPVSVERKRSFFASMRACGLTVQPELIAESSFVDNFAYAILPTFLEFGATGIVCASDLLATYVCEELNKLGVKVPEDVSVVGYDNVPLAEEWKPELTTINQEILEIGKCSFFLLKGLMEGMPLQRLVFRPKLVVRQSTAPAKKS